MGSRVGIIDEIYEELAGKIQQSFDSAQSDWNLLRRLPVVSGRRNSVATAGGSLWIFISGWSLAGMGAQTEIESAVARAGRGFRSSPSIRREVGRRIDGAMDIPEECGSPKRLDWILM
jgi:hypothetical protein